MFEGLFQQPQAISLRTRLLVQWGRYKNNPLVRDGVGAVKPHTESEQ